MTKSDKLDKPPINRRQATLLDGFGARLLDALGRRTFQWLSDETGISTSMLSEYGKGGRTPGADKAVQIADTLGVAIDWLLTGRGSKSGAFYAPADLAAHYDRRAANQVEIASIDLNFGLGAAFMDQEVVEYQVEKMQFPGDWLRSITSSPPSQLYWTRGVGNSMEPAISDGDVILIDRSKVGSTFGDLYWAIAYGQTGMIKRLRPMPDGSVKILSDNPSVPPEVAYDGELHIFGRVVAVVKRL